MSTKTHREDRGLAAVRRVREVRETDSRLGLRTAMAEEAAALVRLQQTAQRLAGSSVPAETSPGALLALRTGLAGLGEQLVAGRAEVATARAIATDARARWRADRTRLAAVDHLLAARSERRQAEAARRATAEADDLAAQRWLRDREAERDTSTIAEGDR